MNLRESKSLSGANKSATIDRLPSLAANSFYANTNIFRKASCTCGGGCPACQSSNLNISQPNDPAEIEADAIADKVMRMPMGEVNANGRSPHVSQGERNTTVTSPHDSKGVPNTIHRKCSACEVEEEKIQRKALPSGGGVSSQNPGHVNSVISSGGRPLDKQTRSFFEPRFGYDLSSVRIHTDSSAGQSARAIDARAYTLGSNIVFGSGEYKPESESGKHLLAHELAHIAQAGGGKIHRCANPKKNDPIYDATAKKIQDHAVYKALDPNPKAMADRILVEAKKKNDCLYLLGKLTQLFNTPKAAAAAIAKSTRTAVAAESTKETARVAKQAKAVTDQEETATKALGAKLLPVVGKFGGGSYLMDKTDLTNVVVKIKILLEKASGATDDDVTKVKGMEDGIEKAAGVKGFTLDVDFVTAADAETFKVKINPEAWTVATQWGSGSTPNSMAHEIFHLMAFSLDRYNYIESHSKNTDMEIPDRLVWFEQQLLKPAGFDDPKSIMADHTNRPTEEDICMIIGGGTVPPDCVKDRKAALKP